MPGGRARGGCTGIRVQLPVTRASARAGSGEATAAASDGVNRRTAEALVVAPRLSFAAAGQTSRMTVAVGASMDTVTPRPAYTMTLSARTAVTVTVVPMSMQATWMRAEGAAAVTVVVTASGAQTSRLDADSAVIVTVVTMGAEIMRPVGFGEVMVTCGWVGGGVGGRCVGGGRSLSRVLRIFIGAGGGDREYWEPMI